MLVLGLEAVAVGHFAEQIFDAAGAGIGHRAAVTCADGNLFVLGADAPILARLGALFEVADQVLFLFNQFSHQSQSRLL